MVKSVATQVTGQGMYFGDKRVDMFHFTFVPLYRRLILNIVLLCMLLQQMQQRSHPATSVHGQAECYSLKVMNKRRNCI